MAATTARKRRKRRPAKTTWRWRVSYRFAAIEDPFEVPAFTREEAEDRARTLAGQGLLDLQVIHVDHAGWRTPYPIRDAESSAGP